MRNRSPRIPATMLASARTASAAGLAPRLLATMLAAACAALAAPLVAQQTPAPGVVEAPQAGDAFVDAGAARLLASARGARRAADAALLSYEAVVRQRMGVALRTPLKDRTIYRQEAAVRVRWHRDGPDVVEILAAREQNPAEVEVPRSLGDLAISGFFDPAGERIYLGLGGVAGEGDDGWIVHPLAPGAEHEYRYRSGDTLTIAFDDGRRLRVVELQVLPRRRSPQLLSGSFWIEPESGALVQAIFRLARDFDLRRDLALLDDDEDLRSIQRVLGTIEFRVGIVVIEYSLWNFQHWMPRLMRTEGVARVGMLRVPLEAEIAYDVSNVVTAQQVEPDSARAMAEADSTLAAWRAGGSYRASRQRSHGRSALVLVPRDTLALLTSPELPPPIWRNAPEFVGDDELQALRRSLDRLPRGGSLTGGRATPHVSWRVASPALLRYNRVEGLSVGARVQAISEPYAAQLDARVGTAELVGDVQLAVARTNTRRELQLAVFHTLRSVDDASAAFGFGASAAALLLGRDDFEYYRAAGAAATLRPSALRRSAWRLTLEAARHAAVARNTHFSLPRWWQQERMFRENIAADAATLFGATAVLAPWWGRDAAGPQAGAELLTHAATGDFNFARARLTLRAAAPLAAGVRGGIELAGGGVLGGVPAQHLWYLGGPASLRGYPGNSARGEYFFRSRVDLARGLPAAGITLFGDAGWAGERHQRFSSRDALLSAGVGVSVLDGLVRADLARALRRPTGWRLELYLDALL